MLNYNGARSPVGCGFTTTLADMDFETYSEGGFIWNGVSFVAPKGATKKGLSAVGAVAYTEHPSAEVLILAYNLKDGLGPRLWIPGMLDPYDLFAHIRARRLIEAFNCSFEYWVWKNICVPKLGWPELPHWILRDGMAKSRAYAWPGGLENAAKISGAKTQKMSEGKRLINKFSIPRKPTKKDPRRRILLTEDLVDGQLFYDYCLGDIKAEAAVSALCPDLTPGETEFWLCTQAMNVRGVALDMATVHAGVSVLDQTLVKYDAELCTLTRGVVKKASEIAKLKTWAETWGVTSKKMDKEAIKGLLSGDLPDPVRRGLEIRQLAGSAAVKKLYAMQRMASKAGRAHDIIIFHVARTGRDGGRDIQPQNLTKAGPDLNWCGGCGKPFGQHTPLCPHCGFIGPHEKTAWSWKAVDPAVEVIRSGSLEQVERIFGDAFLTLSGCIRGLFVPAPGYDFISSDYSSVEAVVTAVLAGETWRIELFGDKQDIYLTSASKVSGIPVSEYLAFKRKHGYHHPDRQKLGKPQELGLGFGGWIGAWRVFDKTDNFDDDTVKHNILAWRDASPGIVEMWGGQVRGKPWRPERHELYGIEGAALTAVNNPGKVVPTNHKVSFVVKDDILFCKLPSGRNLTYHRPRISPSTKWPGQGQVELSFEGWNSNPAMGAVGWIRIQTYGGRLTENIVQAIARDLMAYVVPLLERAGYPIVLRVHDELVAEVPEGFGSIEEFEKIMSLVPAWAKGWPIRAAGGYRAKRYRKD